MSGRVRGAYNSHIVIKEEEEGEGLRAGGTNKNKSRQATKGGTVASLSQS